MEGKDRDSIKYKKDQGKSSIVESPKKEKRKNTRVTAASK